MEQSNFCMERSDFDYGANWLLVGATEYRCTYTYFFGSVLFQILSVSGAGCLKDIAWKVATDEITYLLQSHLQFPHECRRKSLVLWGSARISRNTLRPALTAGCLFSWYEGRPLAFFIQGQSSSRWDVHKNKTSDLLKSPLNRMLSRRRYDHPWAETKT